MFALRYAPATSAVATSLTFESLDDDGEHEGIGGDRWGGSLRFVI
jgi:hypothetical protein